MVGGGGGGWGVRDSRTQTWPIRVYGRCFMGERAFHIGVSRRQTCSFGFLETRAPTFFSYVARLVSIRLVASLTNAHTTGQSFSPSSTTATEGGKSDYSKYNTHRTEPTSFYNNVGQQQGSYTQHQQHTFMQHLPQNMGASNQSNAYPFL